MSLFCFAIVIVMRRIVLDSTGISVLIVFAFYSIELYSITVLNCTVLNIIVSYYIVVFCVGFYCFEGL